MSTLRGTPPQHLFDVDLLWNDPARFEFCFYVSVACVAFLVSPEVSWSPSLELWGSILGAKIVHLGSLGGPWRLEKTSPEKELKQELQRSEFSLDFGGHFGSIFP